MVGCGPDPQRGCIPGMAIGNVRVEMPNPLVPFSFRTQQQQYRRSYVMGGGLVVKVKGRAGGRDYGPMERKNEGRLLKAEHPNKVGYSE